MANPKRGEIWLVKFNPSVGTEIQKARPALVISNDIANAKSSKITVVPLTSRIKQFPIVVIVEPDNLNKLDKQSLIRIPDVCTFDKIRLKNKIGELSQENLKEVDKKLKLHLGLN